MLEMELELHDIGKNVRKYLRFLFPLTSPPQPTVALLNLLYRASEDEYDVGDEDNCHNHLRQSSISVCLFYIN